MPTTSERIELITPLGDELLFHGMHAHEELSRLGEFQLDLLSTNKNVDRDKILGGESHDQGAAARRRGPLLQRVRHPIQRRRTRLAATRAITRS